MVLGNAVSSFKERLSFQVKEHGHEIVVGAIMAGISIALAVAATGDWNHAIAGRGRS